MVSALGYRGVSAFGWRRPSHDALPSSSIVVNNCHCDPIRWKGGPRFRGADDITAALVQHLAARRLGGTDKGEATGLLTHHRDMDEECWAFTSQLLRTMGRHSAVEVLSADRVFSR